MKNKPGAPIGNQNARIHGYYSKILDKNDKRNVKEAMTVNGLDDEINLSRAKIKTLVETDPANFRLFFQASAALARLLRTRQFLAKDKGESLRRAVQKTLSGSPFLDIENL